MKTKWHWFWYRVFLYLSVHSADLTVPYDPKRTSWWHKYTMERFWYHGLKVHDLDPIGLKRFADKCVARAFPVDDWDVE